MKKHLTLIMTLVLPLCLFAQDYGKDCEPFFNSENSIHLEKVLPPPPKNYDIQFVYDMYMYRRGKEQRNTERGALAVEDAHIDADYFMKRFSPAMDHAVNRTSNPILYRLLCRAHLTEQVAGKSAKEYFKRIRPYPMFNEHTSVPDMENWSDSTSYPSGHTHIAWMVGLILSSIDSSHTEPIMAVAYEMGQSRVITGFHFQSDVDAGRLCGSITFAHLCSMPEFNDLLQKAKEEYWRQR